MDGSGRQAAALELLRQPCGAALGADEHQRRAVGDLQEVDQGVQLAVVGDRDEPVVDLLDRLGRRLGLVAAGVVGVGAGQDAHLTVQGGREEHGLAAGRQPADDPVDLRLEAHVEHPVGLVEDEHLDLVQTDHALLHDVGQPAGRSHDDVGGLGGLRLRARADAAVDRGNAQAAGGGDAGELGGHLDGELAGRHQHQGRRPRVIRGQPVDDRQRECQRLAGSGGGLRQDVEAGDGVPQDERLDLERRVDVALGECLGNGLGQAELMERRFGHVVSLSVRERLSLTRNPIDEPAKSENLTGRNTRPYSES